MSGQSTPYVTEITFVVETPLALYTILPVLQQVAASHVFIFLYCPQDLVDRVAFLLRRPNVQIRDLADIYDVRPFARSVHRLLEVAFTPKAYSPQYVLLTRPDRKDLSWRYRWAHQLTRHVPAWPRNAINRRLRALLGPFVSNPFPTRRVVVVSRFTRPHLLCASDQEVITFLESWDHPVKFPMGYQSARVFVWNAALGDDWKDVQGDGDVRVGYPLKLRYALELDRNANALQSRRVMQPLVLYAAGSSSLSYVSSLYQEELRVIDEVCKATGEAGWRLLIKPKPNGRDGDFDRFAAEYDHVEIGAYRTAKDTSDYFLDDEYNRTRFRELASAAVVISCITTFALDAAICGVPVLQLDLRGTDGLPELNRISTNYHLERYFFADPDVLVAPRSADSIRSEVSVVLLTADDRPNRFSANLRSWILPDIGLEDSIQRLVHEVLEA